MKKTWNAETIKAKRRYYNLTQHELADALGCRQQTISEWELGWYEPKNAYSKLLTSFFASKGARQ
jgi:DNA-binding transcriptional regulator YiaG